MRRLLCLLAVTIVLHASVASAQAQAPTQTSWSGPTRVKVGRSFVAHITVEGANTGTVRLLDGDTVIASGELTSGEVDVVAGPLPVGNHNISAAYAGDALHQASQSAARSVSVVRYSALASLASSASSRTSKPGEPVSFSVSLTIESGADRAPAGDVAFFDGGRVVAFAPYDGGAVWTTASLSIGAHSISARFNGDDTYTAAESSALQHTVVASGNATPAPTPAGPVSGQRRAGSIALANPSPVLAPTDTPPVAIPDTAAPDPTPQILVTPQGSARPLAAAPPPANRSGAVAGLVVALAISGVAAAAASTRRRRRSEFR